MHPFDPNYHYYSVDQAAKNMASRGLRVVAFAKGRTLVDLEFIGIIGLHDPPRPGHCQHGLLESYSFKKNSQKPHIYFVIDTKN